MHCGRFIKIYVSATDNFAQKTFPKDLFNFEFLISNWTGISSGQGKRRLIWDLVTLKSTSVLFDSGECFIMTIIRKFCVMFFFFFSVSYFGQT